MTNRTDKIYQQAFDKVSDFRFDSGVVEVFEDMIERSVPGYAAILGMTGELAAQFAQPNTAIYDLGCSLGGSSISMAQRTLPQGVRIQALDNSIAMVEGLNNKLATDAFKQMPIDLSCDCLLYTSPSPRDRQKSRMPSSA